MTERRVINPGDNPYQYGQSLPILPPEQPPITEMDWRKAELPPLFKISPPKGAPNVVIVLFDQSCYPDSKMFGGRICTPTFERLAKNGLTYTNFHVNALCANPNCTVDRAQQPPERAGRHCSRATGGSFRVRPKLRLCPDPLEHVVPCS